MPAVAAKLSMALKPLLHGWTAALFPCKCLACGRLFRQDGGPPVPAATNGRGLSFPAIMATHLCAACRGQWTAVASPLCMRCGMVFNSRVGPDHWCGRCLGRPGHFHKARAIGIYDGSLRLAIHTLKFNGRTSLAGPLGRLLFDTYRHHWPLGDIDLVAPVPLHRKRLRQRGFNQAYLLMRPWQLPVGTAIVRDLLTRTRDTAPQTGLDRRQRQGNIKNAFGMTRPGQAIGKRVLLVDDVLTTGATAEACAGALMRDGALRVDVLTLARA